MIKMNRGVGLHVVKAIHEKYLRGETNNSLGVVSKKENLFKDNMNKADNLPTHIRDQNCFSIANLKLNRNRKSSVK